MIKLDMLRKQICEAARENFEKDGRVDPVACLVRSTAVTFVDLIDGWNDKDSVVQALRAFVLAGALDAVVLVMEAWTYPVEDPLDRREVVTVNVQAPGVSELWSASIRRDDERATLGEFSLWNEPGDKLAGRFTGLFAEVH